MPREDRELVQIEANEDVNSVRDRLSFFRGQRVLLVWPEEGTALTRKLDLVLLQREAMRRQIRMALVTHDPEVMRHATEMNISCFETIGASERGRWKRGRSKVFTNRWQRPKDSPEPDDLKDVASRIEGARRGLSGFQRLLLRLGALLVFVGLVGGIAYVAVPGATVTLAPAEERIEVSLRVTVSTDPNLATIDVEQAIIPSILVPVQVPEQQYTTEASGEEPIGNTRATGAVVFINTTNDQIEIPAGTVVTTTDGSEITFETTQDAVLLPGDGSEIEVPIVALTNSAGVEGNVPENVINAVVGPLNDRVVVRNRVATTGGQAQVSKVVTEEDIDRLERIMYQLIQQRAYEEMPNYPGLTPTSVIIDQTVDVEEPRADWVAISAQPGDRASTVTMRMQAMVTARAFDQQLADDLVYLRLSQLVPRGRIIQPETVNYQRGPIIINGDSISFDMTGSSIVAGRVDADLLRSQLAGRSIDEALEYVRTRVDIAPETQPRIVVSPDLFGRMPIWDRRIEIQAVDPTSPLVAPVIDSESVLPELAPEATSEATAEAGA